MTLQIQSIADQTAMRSGFRPPASRFDADGRHVIPLYVKRKDDSRGEHWYVGDEPRDERRGRCGELGRYVYTTISKQSALNYAMAVVSSYRDGAMRKSGIRYEIACVQD